MFYFSSHMKVMRQSLSKSYAFVKALNRFSLKDTIKHPSKIIHRKFKCKNVKHLENKVSKWDKLRYWAIVIGVPFIILVISFSFISEPNKFFSKSGGMNLSDIKKFIILPGISLIIFISYMIYSYWLKYPTRKHYRQKVNVKHIHIKKRNPCSEL